MYRWDDIHWTLFIHCHPPRPSVIHYFIVLYSIIRSLCPLPINFYSAVLVFTIYFISIFWFIITILLCYSESIQRKWVVYHHHHLFFCSNGLWLGSVLVQCTGTRRSVVCVVGRAMENSGRPRNRCFSGCNLISNMYVNI